MFDANNNFYAREVFNNNKYSTTKCLLKYNETTSVKRIEHKT